MNKADAAIIECVDDALSSFSDIDKEEFYRLLKKDFGLSLQLVIEIDPIKPIFFPKKPVLARKALSNGIIWVIDFHRKIKAICKSL